MDNYYKAMPDEFYSQSSLPVVTPALARDWASVMRAEFRIDLVEHMSGSGRLSLYCLLQGFHPGFPTDYRYGWDLRRADHRELWNTITEDWPCKVAFFSPRCAPWSTAASTKEKKKGEKDRAAEIPTLKWVASVCTRQLRDACGFVVENPRSSAILKGSPHQGADCRCRR